MPCEECRESVAEGDEKVVFTHVQCDGHVYHWYCAPWDDEVEVEW